MATFSWSILTSASTTPGSIANWMSKASITSGTNGVADYIIGEAESWIYRRLRHWRMLTPPTVITLTQGVDAIAITSLPRFLEPMSMWYLNNNAPFWMSQKLPDQIYQLWAFDGSGSRVQQPPVVYSFNDTYIQLDSPPDQTYSGWITYYQQPLGLGDTNQTNFLTDYYQRLMRCACMAAACEWAKDNGQGNFDRTYWDQLAEDELERARMESDRARRGSVNAGMLIGGGDVGYPVNAIGGWGW